jgi:hypothetical protein
MRPADSVGYLAREIDSLRQSIGLPVDDQIDLLDLNVLSDKTGLSLLVIRNAIIKGGGKTIELGTKRYVRKTVWLEVLQGLEGGLEA